MNFLRKVILIILALVAFWGCDSDFVKNRQAKTLMKKMESFESIEELYEIMEKSPNYNYTDDSGLNPYMKALIHVDDIDFLEFFLTKEFDINAQDIEGDSALAIAIKENVDIGIIEKIIHHGAYVDLCNNAGTSPLMMSIGRSVDLPELILKNGCDINKMNDGKETAMTRAIKYESAWPIIPLLIRYGANIQEGEEFGSDKNALIKAIRSGCTMDVIRDLVHSGADVNVIDEDLHYTPLLRMAARGRNGSNNEAHVEGIRFLLRNGADPKIADGRNDSIIMKIAEWKTDYEIISEFVEMGVDINLQRNSSENTVLHLAMENELDYELDIEKIKFLISMGADVNIKNYQSRNPLLFRISNNHFIRPDDTLEVLKLFMDNGLDLNAQDWLGESLLHYVCKYKSSISFLTTLLENDCDVNIKNNKGETPLFSYVINLASRAFWEGSKAEFGQSIAGFVAKDLVSTSQILDLLSKDENITYEQAFLILLKEHGADVNVVCEDGFTPLTMAAAYIPDTKILDLLIEYGADIHHVTPENHNVLTTAVISQSNPAVIQYLVDKGIDGTIIDSKGRNILDLLDENRNLRFDDDVEKLLNDTFLEN